MCHCPPDLFISSWFNEQKCLDRLNFFEIIHSSIQKKEVSIASREFYNKIDRRGQPPPLQGRVIQHRHTCIKTSFTFLAWPHLILSSRWDECNHVFVCFFSPVNVDACCVCVFVCALLLHLSPLCTLDVWLPSPEATQAFHQFSYFLC